MSFRQAIQNTSKRPLRLLQVHAYYQQAGGEDQVLKAENNLLRKYHHVSQFIRYNQDLELMSPVKQFRSTLWNSEIHRDFLTALHHERPDLIHVHNIFPIISPSIYYAAASLKIPIVQTLHNYRLACLSSILYRDESICEDCVGKFPWPGVVHRCYRNSYAVSGTVASMLMLHRGLGTWHSKIDSYISLTYFAKRKLTQAGLDAERIYVKPNFVADPGPSVSKEQAYALFVGRLTPEKGIDTMLNAWKVVGNELPLKIIGTGPMKEHVKSVSQASSYIKYLGRQEPSAVQQFMKKAFVLIFPSVWYETFGLTIIEAFACGLPVIASNLGAAGELVAHGQTGLHFTPGSIEDLLSQIRWLIQNPELAIQMGKKAREEYLEKYTPEKNYQQLMTIYNLAIERQKLKNIAAKKR